MNQETKRKVAGDFNSTYIMYGVDYVYYDGFNFYRSDKTYGPTAICIETGYEEWSCSGGDYKVSRSSGPAQIFPDGSELWILDGVQHREDGPAVTWLMDGGWCYEWWLHGKRHRLDGPAVESPDGSKSWWVNGERVSREWMSVLRVKPDEVEGKKE